MKLYITKPYHTRYGYMKIDNPYNTIEDLINESSVWFMKPKFLKPNICMFEGTIVWNGYHNHGYYSTSIRVSSLPEGQVKEKIKKLIRASISDDFSETRTNRYHTWIGEVDVEFVEKESKGNFNLYLTKPNAHSISFAGVDQCKIWLEQPKYNRIYRDVGQKNEINYNMIVKDKDYISGKIFRKTPELNFIMTKIWKALVESFDIEFKDSNDFYMKINDKNHKKGMSSRHFSAVFFFDLVLKDNSIQ